jgi:hypothetical protein
MPYPQTATMRTLPSDRGVHSFIVQLNLSAFCVTAGGRGYEGWLGCAFVSETAQVELNSGRV